MSDEFFIANVIHDGHGAPSGLTAVFMFDFRGVQLDFLEIHGGSILGCASPVTDW